MNGKLNSEKRRGKKLLAQQQYRITHDFTMLRRLNQKNPDQIRLALMIWWLNTQKQGYFWFSAASFA